MAYKWQKHTCASCRFQINTRCRRFPPNYESKYYYSNYPRVRHDENYLDRNDFWQEACSEYKRKEYK